MSAARVDLGLAIKIPSIGDVLGLFPKNTPPKRNFTPNQAISP